MKKYTLFFIWMCLIFILSACTDKKEEEKMDDFISNAKIEMENIESFKSKSRIEQVDYLSTSKEELTKSPYVLKEEIQVEGINGEKATLSSYLTDNSSYLYTEELGSWVRFTSSEGISQSKENIFLNLSNQLKMIEENKENITFTETEDEFIFSLNSNEIEYAPLNLALSKYPITSFIFSISYDKESLRPTLVTVVDTENAIFSYKREYYDFNKVDEIVIPEEVLKTKEVIDPS